MKRTHKKLALQKTTIRPLQAPALGAAQGGMLKSFMTDCSGTCWSCDATCTCNYTKYCSDNCP